MGEVYRARDGRLGREVAVKVLPPEVTAEAGRLERFDREARAIAALNHPHIVTIYSTEEAGGIRFLTMELVEGKTLNEVIVSSGLPLARFLEIALQIADALTAAHQKQITHRDLKPGNVMVTHDGRVKVLDFGLARVGGSEAPEHSLAATQAPITHQGMLVGTMPYMSPEQVEGKTPDPRSDLFSLGVIFYEMLSGERPFKGTSSPGLMSAILRDTPPGICDVRSDVPDGLGRLIARCIEKRPEDRVQTARDVYNELRHVQKQLDGGSRAASSGARRATPIVADNLSVAVLPFAVRGTDPDGEAMASALTDDITASLARFPGLSVVASQSTRAFKDSPIDIRQIAERLGARYIVGGMVRKSGATIRSAAHLIDAQSGAQLWSETYDRSIGEHDLFAIQDDLTDHIVASVGDPTGVLARSMTRAVRQNLPAEELTTRELLLKAWGLQQSPTPNEHLEMRAAIESRLKIEPDNAQLWAELAHLYLDEHILGMNPQPDPLGRSLTAARRAIELDPNNQRGWGEQAAAYFFLRNKAGLIESAERAIRINPRNGFTVAWMGNLLTHAGEYDRGSALSQRAMTINPAHPGWAHFGVFNRHLAARDFAEALNSARRVNMPQLNWMHLAIAAAASQLGLMDEARRAYEAAIAITPAFRDPAILRDFIERWYWDDALVEAQLEGIARVHDAPQPLAAKPPSSTSGTRSASGARGNRAMWVAVLPFQARSNDEDSRSLADALTEDITTGLSRFGYLRVVSRAAAERLAMIPSSSPPPATQPVPRFALEGTVRKAGGTVRVGVRIIDTESGTNVWAENFDRDAAAGTFSLQDELTARIVATVGDNTGVLSKALAVTLIDVPLEQLAIEELAVRYHAYGEHLRGEEHARLRDAFERYLEREPNSAAAWALLSRLVEHEHAHGLNPLPDSLGRQRRAAERAVEIDPRHQQAWTALAAARYFSRDLPGMRAAIQRAMDINPLNADHMAFCALLLSAACDDETALPLVQRSMTNKPQHPGWYHFVTFNAYYRRGAWEDALAESKRINMPLLPTSHYAVAAAAGRLGRAVDARLALEALRRLSPALADTSTARRAWGVWSWSAETVDPFIEGLEAALAIEKSKVASRSPASRPASSPDLSSIAVLPFTDLSPAKDQEWFCDGIAEEILNALSPLPGLRVAARASAFSFRGKVGELHEIAERLNVATVLEGSVRRAGDRVRITAQLSDARQGVQLWSERFDRELRDIFDVQDEIARGIADRLRLTLTSDGSRLVTKATSSIAAYEALLKGRVLLTRRGGAIIDAAACFEQALSLDANLSEAHALLGDTYRLRAIYGLAPAAEMMPLARAKVEQALALDPEQVEALATIANLAIVYDWDGAAWRAAVRRALTAAPSHVRALAEYGVAFHLMTPTPPSTAGSALEGVSQARALDPLNAWVMAIEATCLSAIERTDEAVDAARRAVAADDGNFTAHLALVDSLARQERHAAATEAANTALAMSARHPRILAALAAIHARLGDTGAAEAIHQELQQRARSQYVPFAELTVVAASAGRLDEARVLLNQALAGRDPYLTFWKLTAWRPVWNDPGCAAILRASPLLQVR